VKSVDGVGDRLMVLVTAFDVVLADLMRYPIHTGQARIAMIENEKVELLYQASMKTNIP
jgi:hypothetical protein